MCIGIILTNLKPGEFIERQFNSFSGLPQLLDSQMRPKPVYVAIDKLINKEYRTNITAVTDPQGQIKFRGFYGNYKLIFKDTEGKVQVVKINVQKKKKICGNL